MKLLCLDRKCCNDNFGYLTAEGIFQTRHPDIHEIEIKAEMLLRWAKVERISRSCQTRSLYHHRDRLMNISTLRSYLRNSFMSGLGVEAERLFAYRRRAITFHLWPLRPFSDCPRHCTGAFSPRRPTYQYPYR